MAASATITGIMTTTETGTATATAAATTTTGRLRPPCLALLPAAGCNMRTSPQGRPSMARFKFCLAKSSPKGPCGCNSLRTMRWTCFPMVQTLPAHSFQISLIWSSLLNEFACQRSTGTNTANSQGWPGASLRRASKRRLHRLHLRCAKRPWRKETLAWRSSRQAQGRTGNAKTQCIN